MEARDSMLTPLHDMRPSSGFVTSSFGISKLPYLTGKCSSMQEGIALMLQ